MRTGLMGPLQSAANLSVNITGTPDPVRVDRPLTYTLSIANHGPDVATGVSLTDTLPEGARLVSVRADRGRAVSAAGVVRVDLERLEPGSRAAVTLVVRPSRPGSVINTARVGAREADPNPADNEGTAAVSVTTGIGPDLAGVWSGLLERCVRQDGALRCSLTGTFQVQNRGTGPTGPFAIRFFLSADPVLDSSDALLKEMSVESLRRGQLVRIPLTHAYPATSLRGMRLIAVLDAEGRVDETNERNNLALSGPIR